jgi:hypothetical protein
MEQGGSTKQWRAINEAVTRQHKKWKTIENGSVRQCVEWKSDKRTIGVEQGMGGSAEGNDGED